MTDLHPDRTHFLGFWDLAIILPLSHCILGIQFDQWNLLVQEVPEKKLEKKISINLSGKYPNLEENFLRTEWKQSSLAVPGVLANQVFLEVPKNK